MSINEIIVILQNIKSVFTFPTHSCGFGVLNPQFICLDFVFSRAIAYLAFTPLILFSLPGLSDIPMMQYLNLNIPPLGAAWSWSWPPLFWCDSTLENCCSFLSDIVWRHIWSQCVWFCLSLTRARYFWE